MPHTKSEIGFWGNWQLAAYGSQYSIGNPDFGTETNNTIIFDNQTVGIRLTYASAQITNCLFQSTPEANALVPTFGILARNGDEGDMQLYTYRLHAPANAFFDIQHAIESDFLTDVQLKGNVIRSSKTVTTVNDVHEGFEGINVKNSSEHNFLSANKVYITDNEISNIAFPISFSYENIVPTSEFPTNIFHIGSQLCGDIRINKNIIKGALDIDNKVNTRYFTEQAITLNVSIPILRNTSTTPFPAVFCRQNNLYHVRNGIDISNFAGKDIRAGVNFIYLYDNDVVTTQRAGIRTRGCNPESGLTANLFNLNTIINYTTITTSANKYGIVMENGFGFTNQCYATTDFNSHFRYISDLRPIRFWDNSLKASPTKILQQRGLHLVSGIIGQQGFLAGGKQSTNRPCNNRYTPNTPWNTAANATSFKTFCQSSDPTTSPMYVQQAPTGTTNAFDPANSSVATGLTPIPYSFTSGLINAPNNSAVQCGNNIVFKTILINDEGREYEIKVPDWDIMDNYEDDMYAEENAGMAEYELETLLNTIENGWQDVNTNNSLKKYTKLMGIYNYLLLPNSLANTNAYLSNFVQQQQAGSFGTINTITKNISQGNFSNASTLLNNWQKNNVVDENYASFFNWLLQYQQNLNTNLDALTTLATLCPQTNGNIVFAAQNLYNSITGEHQQFFADCNADDEENIASRTAINTTLTDNITIYPNPANSFVIIKAPKAKQVQLINALGVIVYSSKVLSHNFIVPLNNYNTGWYCVKIINTDGKVITKNILRN